MARHFYNNETWELSMIPCKRYGQVKTPTQGCRQSTGEGGSWMSTLRNQEHKEESIQETDKEQS